MKKSNTAFLTTIFPVSKPFLKDFFNSLQKQSFKNFDIIVINDGITDFYKIKNLYPELNIIEYHTDFSPPKNREFGIKKTIELEYENIILGDSDDYFDENRVAVILELLNKNNIVINDIHLFNEKETKKNFFSKFVQNQEYNINDFITATFAGFSNTAIKTSLLKKNDMFFFDELIAVDWYFLTTLLLQNSAEKVFFTNETGTYYRQHKQNTIGINETVNFDKIKFGLKIKTIHYDAIIKFCKINHINNFLSIFECRKKEMQLLKKKIKNKVFFDKYITVIKNNFDDIFKGWWSEIIPIKKFEQYENKSYK